MKRKKRTRFKTMEILENMLDEAMDGTFEEGEYDESRLSRLETKWRRFLSSSMASKRRVEEEQGRIKSLISDISHQTKTPIANILLYSQLLQERERDPELVPIVENIREQSEKLDFLIRSLVKASRLEGEIFVLNPENQPLMPMLASAVSGAGEEASAKGIRVILEPSEAFACFDRKWTEEAIGNLIDNAVKYSPPNTEVRVKVKEYEMFAAVQVEDQGIGIREEEQAQIFERFYRSRDAAQEKGVGIGLYLVREIAAKQNGYVKVKSGQQGSIFSFYISKNEK